MKKKIVLYVLLVIVAISSGSLFIDYNKVQNVFDEMYYTWDGYFKFFIHTKFKNVPALENERIGGTIIPGDNSPTNELSLTYDEKYLKEMTDVSVWISPDGKNLGAICSIIFAYPDEGEEYVGGEKLYIEFYYDIRTKILRTEPMYAISDIFVEHYPDKYKQYYKYDDSEYIEMFMAEHNITKEDIEAYRDYFLYDVLIGMWVDGNDKESRYDRNDAGHFVLKDELFANFE